MTFNFNRQLLQVFVPDYKRSEDSDVRTRIAFLEAWVSIVGNSLLGAAKIYLGIVYNSIALIADAVHTISDVATSVVVIWGFSQARKPADRQHPFGHGRVEAIATLIIAVLLGVVGFEFASSSVNRIISGESPVGNLWVAVVVLMSGVLKEWMAGFSAFLGKMINSGALIADAWHHRSDAIASVLVSLSIGAAFFGYRGLDGFLGVGVSVLIIWTALKLGKESASSLIGESPDDSLVRSINEAVLQVDGVKSMHKITVHDYGNHKLASLHILVDKNLHVPESHAIAGAVKSAVKNALGIDTEVHVEPYPEKPVGEGTDEPGRQNAY